MSPCPTLPTHDIDADGARRLACAVLARAVKDAQLGDLAARLWLGESGAEWADALDIDRDSVRAWAGRPSAAALPTDGGMTT